MNFSLAILLGFQLLIFFSRTFFLYSRHSLQLVVIFSISWSNLDHQKYERAKLFTLTIPTVNEYYGAPLNELRCNALGMTNL